MNKLDFDPHTKLQIVLMRNMRKVIGFGCWPGELDLNYKESKRSKE